MAALVPDRMTADEFLGFEGEGDTRYQLFDGVVMAAPLENTSHGTVLANAIF